jgi:hypothetical protein
VLFLAGKTFQITGTIDSAAAPVSSGTGTATYSFPSLTITIGALTVSLPGVPVTFTITSGNVATVSVGTSFTGIPISAVIGLPPGTMTIPSPTAFSQVAIAAGNDPVLGSILTYGQAANTTVLAVTGNITASASGPSLIASPSALSFGFLLGGPPAPPPQTFQIDAGANASLSVATDGAGWISVDPPTGITPAVFTVTVDPSGLSAGVYTSQISITSPEAGNSPLIVPVQFVVSNPPPLNVGNQYPPLNRGEFVQAAPQGFGDRQNGWAWSMEWFKGKLYVGTNRAFHCVEAYAIHRELPLYQPYPPKDPDIECAQDPNDLPLQAEIWAWAPDTNTWTRVFQSPLSIPNPDAPGKMLPPDIGFRGMLVFTEPDGTQAMYVSGVCAKAIHPSGIPGARILRTVDGINFQPVPQTPGTFLGDANFAGFRGLTAYNGSLYLIAGTLQGAGVVIGSANPALGDDSFQQVTPPGLKYYEVGVYNNFLYATQSDQKGFAVVKTDASMPPPYNFSVVIPNGGYRKIFPNVDGLSFKIFNGDLYVGGDGIHSFFGAELFRVHADDTWDVIAGVSRDTPVGFKQPISGLGPGFGWFMNAHMWRMEVFDDRLYVGTFDLSTTFRNLPLINVLGLPELGTDLWWTQDGANWFLVDQNGLGDKFNFGTRSLKKTDWGLFLGTANYFYGLQIWRGIPAGFNFPPVVNPADPIFNVTVGATTPISQNLQISSVSSPATFTVSAAVTTPVGGNWLQVSLGVVTPPTGPSTTPLTITANPTGLNIGAYTGVITFTGTTGVQRDITVTLNVTPETSLTAAPRSLNFVYQQGGPLPLAQTISVGATGAPVSFSALPSVTTPTNGSWLQVSPSSGSAPVSGSADVQVTINPLGLAPGDYTGVIVLAGASQGPQQVGVALTVTTANPSGSPSELTVDAHTISLEWPFGAELSGQTLFIGSTIPPPQAIAIGSTNAPLAFTATASSPGNWLVLDAVAGTTPPLSGLTVINAWIDTTILLAGSYTGTITITAPGASNSPQTITVKLSIVPANGDASNLQVSPFDVMRTRDVSHIANGQGWTTSFLLVNADSKQHGYTLDFSADNGLPLSLPAGGKSITNTIPPGGLGLFRTDGAGMRTVVGWAKLTAPAAVGGTAIFTAQSDGRPPSEAAVPLVMRGGRTLYLPFDQTNVGALAYATGMALANLTAVDAVAVITFIDDTGTAAPLTGTVTVPAHGHYAAVLGDIFPALLGKRGVAKITSNADLSGLGIRYNGTAFTSINALSNVPQGSKTISHLANGQGWTTTILLVNTETFPASFKLSFFKDDGTPLVMPLGPVGTTSSLTGTIPAGQLRVIQSTGAGDTLQMGSAVLSTTAAIGGTAIFTAQSAGQPPSEAGVPLIPTPSPELLIPFDQASAGSGFATGIALANPNPTAAHVTLAFADENGQALPPVAAFIIPAQGHYATVLGTTFPQLQGKRGVVVAASSDGTLTGLGIRFNGTAYTALPAIVPGN